MIRKVLMILFLTFSNPCSSVLTPERANKLIEWILNDPLDSEIILVGLFPCNRFEALPPAFDTTSENHTQFLTIINEELLELFEYLLNQITYYPRDYKKFKEQKEENKKLYRVVCTVFCFLIMRKVLLEEFYTSDIEKSKKEIFLIKLNCTFQNHKNFDSFLNLFPVVLYHFSLIRFFPQSVELNVDKPEPHFCHWISKAAMIILENERLNTFFLSIPNSKRANFFDKLKQMKSEIFNLFVYTCEKISGTDQAHSLYPTPDAIIIFKPKSHTSQYRPTPPVIEPPIECSQLEDSLFKTKTTEFKNTKRHRNNRSRKKRISGGITPIPTIQEPFFDEEQGVSPSSTSSPSISENSHWDGPLLDLEPSQEGFSLMRGRDCEQRAAVLRRPNSAPPVVQRKRESF